MPGPDYELKQVLKSMINDKGPMAVSLALEEIFDEWREFLRFKDAGKEKPVEKPVKGVHFKEVIEKLEAPKANPVVEPLKPVVDVPKEEQTDKKAKHIAVLLAKRKELEEKEENPEDYLTEERLTQWINEGKSYWDIAELTGCPDALVSSTCRVFNLKSQAAQRIAQLKSMKK